MAKPLRDDDFVDERPDVVTGDSTGGVIPYKNPSALIAYYLGVFSLIPLLGIPLGLAAVVLGIIGIRYRNRHPAAKGLAHAWVGIILGGVMALLYTSAVVIAVVAIMNSSGRR